jgi:hypothetical protein
MYMNTTQEDQKRFFWGKSQEPQKEIQQTDTTENLQGRLQNHSLFLPPAAGLST